VGCAARPDEICVVGVRKTVRSRTSRSQDRLFLERQDHTARSGGGEHGPDRLGALCIRHRVASTVENAEFDAFALRQAREEACALRSSGTDLEVRRARAAHRPSAEKRPAKIGRATARPRNHTSRRMFEWSEALCEHARLVQDLKCAPLPGDVKLISRQAVERATAVRPDFRSNSERA